MDSQKIAGALAALIGAAVFVIAFSYMQKKGVEAVKPQAEKARIEPTKAPVAAPTVRGPVVRDITPEK